LLPYRQTRDKVLGTLQILGLEGTQKRFPSELSGGMRKRVEVARDFIQKSGIDIYGIRRVPPLELAGTKQGVDEPIAALPE